MTMTFSVADVLLSHSNRAFVRKSVVLFGDQGGLTVRNQIIGPPDFHAIGTQLWY